jgi:hypothetical protein
MQSSFGLDSHFNTLLNVCMLEVRVCPKWMFQTLLDNSLCCFFIRHPVFSLHWDMYSLLPPGRQIYFRFTIIVDHHIEMQMGHSWQHKVWQNCLLKLGIVHACWNLYVTYFHCPTVNNLNLVEFQAVWIFLHPSVSSLVIF